MVLEVDAGGCDGENVTVRDVAEVLVADVADRCVLGGDWNGDVAAFDVANRCVLGGDWSGVLGDRREEVSDRRDGDGDAVEKKGLFTDGACFDREKVQGTTSCFARIFK